jgi:hypothetical protein
MIFPNKRLAVSNGITSEASNEENESLIIMDDSKGVEHGRQEEQAESRRSNDERRIRAAAGKYYNKSRIVGVMVGVIVLVAAFVFYWLEITSETKWADLTSLAADSKPRAKLNLNTTTSFGSADEDALTTTTTHETPPGSAAAETLKRLRFDLAAISIDMMKSDMATDANSSKFIDIGPLCDLVESALEEFGIWGVFRELLEANKFIESLTAAAEAKDVHGFSVKLNQTEGKQPSIQYTGVPNDREFYENQVLCNGCKWWLDHYVGAVSADVFMRKGSLKLDRQGEQSISDAAAIVHELQKMQRLEDADISTHHVGHGFTWQYLAVTMDRLNSYPLIMANEFCGDLLWKDEYHSRLNNDIGRECRHGFGHAVFYVLVMRENGGLEAYSVRKQVRPASGFRVSNKSMCDGYEICKGAPNDKTWLECIGGLRHSYLLVDEGVDRKPFNFKKNCEKRV